MVMDMVGSTLNLSKLSRGIGEVKNNGHERIDVVLEPEVSSLSVVCNKCQMTYIIIYVTNVKSNVAHSTSFTHSSYLCRITRGCVPGRGRKGSDRSLVVVTTHAVSLVGKGGGGLRGGGEWKWALCEGVPSRSYAVPAPANRVASQH